MLCELLITSSTTHLFLCQKELWILKMDNITPKKLRLGLHLDSPGHHFQSFYSLHQQLLRLDFIMDKDKSILLSLEEAISCSLPK